jgi:phosphatidylethanolamine-binding protein (PEBP) family uncharacterized protein
MSFVGYMMLRGVRAGERGLLWNSEAGKAAPASIELVSDAFDSGATIPRGHAGDGVGENVSPALAWHNIPRGTAELALVIEDADAPLPRPFVHTVVTAIPPDVNRISEGVMDGREHPGVFGKGSFGGDDDRLLRRDAGLERRRPGVRIPPNTDPHAHTRLSLVGAREGQEPVLVTEEGRSAGARRAPQAVCERDAIGRIPASLKDPGQEASELQQWRR